ncbi:MAG: hypothetical protein Fur0010_26720 [Bdellovibrio sp.]
MKKCDQNRFQINQAGFSLIEILIALFLGSLLLVVTISGIKGLSQHDVLERQLVDFDRAVRFIKDEAILRNAVVRLRIYLSKEPQEFTVEYGPDGNFVIPKFMIEAEEVSQSLSDAEKREKELKRFNQKFAKVDEYEDENKEINQRIKVYGIANTTTKKIITEGEMAIYAYPNGEIDESIILLASDDEIAYLKIPALQQGTESGFKVFETKEGDLAEIQKRFAEEVYSEWLK